MLSDAWVSFGVVVSGGIIMLTGWSVLDPLVSLFVVLAIVGGPGRSLKNHLRSSWSPPRPASAPRRSPPPSNPFPA
jgi:cobalt-zinc-cadmium efflux system protein